MKKYSMRNDSGKAWVIEDDLTYQHFVTSYLTTLGYTTRSFSSGEACFQYLAEKPDIIILDQHLEGEMKGVEVLQKLKSEFPDIPIIFISSQQKLSLVAETYRNGSEDYIEKNSASLIRLKIRLDSIQKQKSINVARRIKGILLFAVLCLIWLTVILYFRN